MSAYDQVLERVHTGDRLRTPDDRTGQPFTADNAVVGDRWLEVKDEDFQTLLNMENDRVRASSYVLALLGAARVIDIDGSRPNRVRLKSV